MKDAGTQSASRHPYGTQVGFLRRALDYIDLSPLDLHGAGTFSFYEKRGSQSREVSCLSTSRYGPHPEVFVDHIHALLDVIVPCDEHAMPIQEFVCNGQLFQIIGCQDESFAFVYPVPPPELHHADFNSAALAVLTDYLWLGDRADQQEFGYRAKPQATLLLPDLGSRVSRRIKTQEVQPLYSVAQSEPLIVAFGRYLSALLRHHKITDKDGRAIEIPFFRLRSAKHWIVTSDEAPNANEVFAYLSRVCNIACDFCYLFGNPSTISVARGAKTISKDEMDLRMAMFDPAARETLFHATWEVNEILVDPKFEPVAQSLRRQTDDTFFFITNGNPLTPAKVALLETIKPVELIISTNTVDFRARSELMHEKETLTKVALGCFDDLDSREICYGISMVAMPGQSFDELELTIRELDRRKPAFIRLNLVGYTRDHPGRVDFEISDFWGKTVRWVQALRRNVLTPIILIPSAYEENFFYDRPNAARVIGSILGSPARDADLRPGDEIIAVGAMTTTNRAQVRGLLSVIDRPTPLRILRDGTEMLVTIDPTRPHVFPFVGDLITKYFVPKGVVMAPALSPSDFSEIARVIRNKRCRSVAILTSPLMRPAVEDLLGLVAFDDVQIHLVSVQNDFLGGNICVLDMATVSDMVTSIRKQLPGIHLDHIFVPASSFNGLGRDLSGQHWDDIERSLGAPIKVLHSTTQFAF